MASIPATNRSSNSPEPPCILVTNDDGVYAPGIRALHEAVLAFSLAGEAPFDFDVAAGVAWKLSAMALEFGLPDDTLLNINIPQRAAGEIRGIRFTRQGRRIYRNAIQENFDPRGRKHYWIGGGTVQWSGGDNTDEKVLREGFISVTPIQLDLTNHPGLDYLPTRWQM